jgi:magnesium-protoporphyrin O-methyltransferase
MPVCGANCCGFSAVFDEKCAVRDLDSYRRRGPSASTSQLLAAVRGGGQSLDTLLDVGGGIGAISHELLDGIVTRATLVEGSPTYLRAARAESERRDTIERLQLKIGDFVEIADDLEPADVVTLDKVVCCYPDMESLLSVSGSRARRLYGIIYPRDVWWVRSAIAVENRIRRLRGNSFRNYIHANSAIDAALSRVGLSLRFQNRGAWWVVALYERVTPVTT